MVTWFRSGSYSQTFWPLETSICSAGASVCQRNKPGRLSDNSPAVSCSWVPEPSRVSWENRAVSVCAWLSKAVKRATATASSAWAGATAKAITASNSMRKARMKILFGLVSLNSVADRTRSYDLTGAICAHGRYHPGHFHGFHHACGAVVADFQLALHGRNGRPAAFGDEAHGLVVQRIFFTALAALTAAAVKAAAGLFDASQNLFDVIRGA